ESASPVNVEERVAWLALTLIPDLGNRSILRLLRHFGSPGEVLRAKRDDLAAVPRLREKARERILGGGMRREAEAEWETLTRFGASLLCLGDPDYPSNLAEIPDPPAVLYVRGALEPGDLVSIAIVGSRAASPTGMIFTERLATDLARYGITVVSGFARGIDSSAHRGALKGNGRTLAVLGCGLDLDYPLGNADLKKEIGRSGAVVSEFSMARPPAPENFPMRNRIISGLSLGVVVVEAAQRSGSLITARLALEQGREVFAVPGVARQSRSVGPHTLLKQGAKLVECAEDIIEEIRPLLKKSGSKGAHKGVAMAPVPDLDSDEAAMIERLDETPQHIDDICRAIQWSSAKATATLLGLELKGAVRQLPGMHFISLL
ncbi:MAG: DNA-processing protein DprA, partial [Acidobacteriota bacterium]